MSDRERERKERILKKTEVGTQRHADPSHAHTRTQPHARAHTNAHTHARTHTHAHSCTQTRTHKSAHAVIKIIGGRDAKVKTHFTIELKREKKIEREREKERERERKKEREMKR